MELATARLTESIRETGFSLHRAPCVCNASASIFARLWSAENPHKAVLMQNNDLYLAVLPLIHVSMTQQFGFGLTEQTLTLFPDRNFATEFFADEVEGYITTFKNRTQYLTGGHVTGWEVFPEQIDNGRVIVRVVQHVE